MIHIQILGLLTLQLLALTGAVALHIYVGKQQLAKWYSHISKTIVVLLHVFFFATVIHGIVHHFHSGTAGNIHHEIIQNINHEAK